MPRARRSRAPNSFFAQARGAELTNAVAKRRGARRDATLLARDEDDRGIGTPRGVPPRGGGMEHRRAAHRHEKNAGRRDVDAPSTGGLERDRDGGERQPGSAAGDAHGRGGRRRRGPRRVRAHDRRRAEGSAARPGAARGRQEGRARGARDFAHIIRRRGVLHVHRGVARSTRHRTHLPPRRRNRNPRRGWCGR